MSGAVLHAFAAFGIEIEYMIVDRESLDVRPLADRLLETAAGEATAELERGTIAWSNELSLHVIELKTNGPAPGLDGLDRHFAAELAWIDELLAPLGARILPGAMHPWMDPHREQHLWPHEQNEIYRAYDRLFDCRGHGWANLQSMHVNLPFADETEFVRLHDAIRAALPLLPALAAASPFADGRVSGVLDTRIDCYRNNQRRIPEITGQVIPERIASIDEYHARILEPMYAAVAPYDPQGVLHGEWLNSRGAIARFDRDAIEIRVLDAQESPRADLAVARAVTGLVRALYEERTSSAAVQARLDTGLLAEQFLRCMRDADRARLAAPLRDALGLGREVATAGAAWRVLGARHADADDVRSLVEAGPLARRLLAACGSAPDRAALRALAERLAQAARDNAWF